MGTRDSAEGHHTPLSHLGTFLSLYKAHIWTVVVYAAFVGLLALATPVAVQALVTTAAFGTVLQPIVVLVLLLFMGLAFSGVLQALKAWVVEVLQRRMFLDAVARLTLLLPRLDTAHARARGMAHPEHRFFEVFTIQKAMASLLVGGVDVVLAIFVGLTVLAFYHPMLLAFDVLLLAALFAIVFGLGRGGVATSVRESSAKYSTATFLTEVAHTQAVFRHAAGRQFARKRLDELASEYLLARAAHFRVLMRQIIGALVTQALASAAVLGLGGYLVVGRELTLGQLVAAELIVTVVVSALSDLGKHIETYYDLVTGVYKLDALLELPAEGDPAQGLRSDATGPAEVRLRAVHLAYNGRAVFDGASLDIARGERVWLHGPAESGKSTLLALLFGSTRADQGLIQLDGADVRELSLDSLRERVAVVGGPEIVPGTVIENVLLGRDDIPVGRVRTLLERLGLTEELWHFPQGLDSRVGPGGMSLTYSQAFRVTLARALVREPGLLAVDANLSAVDSRSLGRAMAELTHEGAPWTLILVGNLPGDQLVGARSVHLEAGRFEEGKTP